MDASLTDVVRAAEEGKREQGRREVGQNYECRMMDYESGKRKRTTEPCEMSNVDTERNCEKAQWPNKAILPQAQGRDDETSKSQNVQTPNREEGQRKRGMQLEMIIDDFP